MSSRDATSLISLHAMVNKLTHRHLRKNKYSCTGIEYFNFRKLRHLGYCEEYVRKQPYENGRDPVYSVSS